MEPEDPHPHEGTGHQADSNVVPFPRDWLGPPEELVPLGRSESSSAPTEASPAGPGAQSAETAPDPASLAEDFWGGEGSGAIHEVLQAPDADEPGALVGGHGRFRPDLAASAVRRLRAIALTHPVVLMLCSVAGVALGVGILTAPGRRAGQLARVHGSAAARVRGSAAGASRADRLIAGAQVAVMPPIEKVAPSRPAADHARAARAHRATGGESNAKPANTTPAVGVGYKPASTGSAVPATSDQSAYAANSARASTPAAEPAAEPSSSSSAPSVGASTSSGSTTGTSASPPPSNPSPASSASSASRPAFGANGILGPGTSPNS